MLILVLGGTRSGKSAVAERLVTDGAAPGAVTYVATARVDTDDVDHTARIAAHQARRPSAWSTVECPDADRLASVLRALDGPVLLDSLGTWVTGFPDCTPSGAEVDGLVAVLAGRADPTVVVSEEVGLSPHAPTWLGRRFADALGSLNQAVSRAADRAVLVVAGRVLELPPPGAEPC